MSSGRSQRRRLGSPVSSTAAVLVLLLAGLLSALVLMLHRQASRTNVQQATVQLRTAAELAAAALLRERADLRTRATRLAASPRLQRAVARDDLRELRAIARANRATVVVGGTRIGRLPAQPRLATTAVLRTHVSVAARLTLALPLRPALFAKIRGRLLLPAHATLLIATRHSRSSIAATSVYGSALLAPGVRVVAVEPRVDVAARTAAYTHRLVVAALLTLLVAIVVAGRLARPLRTMVGDLSHRADADALTGLANRRLLDERLRDEVERAARYETHLALVLLDIDDFKRINDRYGHPCGDDVLQAVARVLNNSVREIDLVGRFGGEEFAVILPGTAAVGGVRVAEQIRDALTTLELVAPNGDDVAVTASFGVADFPEAPTLEELVERADSRLYRAKQSGKNRVVGADHRASVGDVAAVTR